ncbi:MAG: DUF123 domain-containing protein [Promethearchaeota archaeon]
MPIREKNSQGVYILVLKVSDSNSIRTSQFKWLLHPGIYLYFGSARGKTSTSLEKRIIRHYRRQKKIFWHIDHLTSNLKTKLLGTYYTTDLTITECQALQEFSQNFHEVKIISQFGSSDCKSKCGGHLLFISNNQDISTKYIRYFHQKDLNECKFDSIFKENTTSVLN